MSVPGKVSKHLRGMRHVGIVTEDSAKLVERLKELFDIQDSDIVHVPAPGEPAETRFVFLEIGGLPYEIIEPVSERFKELLLNSNQGVNHVCYTVDNMDAAVAAMNDAGARLGHVTPDGVLSSPRSRIAYFDPATTGGILIEFVEPRK